MVVYRNKIIGLEQWIATKEYDKLIFQTRVLSQTDIIALKSFIQRVKEIGSVTGLSSEEGSRTDAETCL